MIIGVLQGLLITLKHFLAAGAEAFAPPRTNGPVHQGPEQTGVFTVQYPEERLAVPERFRYFPMLLRDESGKPRCTSCGICAKVCPPQCIWIVRSSDESGKPIPEPKDFVIDTSICMQCGFCAEFCPFDAIKMDHQYELASYERMDSFILHKERLLMPLDYYARTHPTDFAAEEEERRQKEEADRRKAEERAKAATAAKARVAATPASVPAARARPAAPEAAGASSPASPAAPARPPADVPLAGAGTKDAATEGGPGRGA
ncbi:MAG: NADH-quinone oxidoreductase subunit I [Chloroflexi bacterium]|nr:NADH-quinone oxidoreductase subunit I [Chloroflexota bacterium]